MTTTQAEVSGKLANLGELLRQVRGKLIEGEMVDVTGLDGIVIDICADVAELAPTERVALESDLNVVMSDLKQIGTFLQEQAEAVDAAIERRDAGTQEAAPAE